MLDWHGVVEMRDVLARGWASVGRWSAAATALAEDGSPEAAEVLAAVYVNAGSMQRGVLRKALLALVDPVAIERVWWVWSQLRSDALADVFACRPLRLPCRVDLLALSRLKIGLREELCRMGTRDVVTEVVKASADKDRLIAGSAAAALLEMADQPLAVSVMADAVCSTSAAAASTRACLAALGQVRGEKAIDALCAAWVRSRHPALAALLDRGRHVASASVEAAALTRLRLGLDLGVEHAATVLLACDDREASLAKAAMQRLAKAPSEWRPALAEAVLHGHCPASARALVADAAPRDPAPRALFFLLTDQFDRALDLDFDLSMLSAAYRTAAPAVRRRVAAAIRRSGSGVLIRILARKQGDDYVHLTMSDVEWETLVQGLDQPERVDELWSLMIDAPAAWSADIHERLVHMRYRPTDDAQALWAELSQLRPRLAKVRWGDLETASEPTRRYARMEERPGPFVIVSDDGRVRVRNDPYGVREYEELDSGRKATMQEARRFDRVALSHDGRRIAVARNDEWRVYDVDLDRSMHQFSYAFGETVQPGVGAMRFSPDGRYLAVATREGVDVYEMAQGRRVGRVPLVGTALAFDEDGRLLAVGGGKECVVYEVPSLTTRHVLTGAKSVVEVFFGAGAATVTAQQEYPEAVEWSLCRTPTAAFSLNMQMKAETQAKQSVAWAWAAALLAYRRRYDIEIEDDVFVPDSSDIEIEVA